MDVHLKNLEERCLVDEGEAILNKKAVYEPTKGQKFRQIVCSKTWALCILFSMAIVIVAVAAMAAFARPAFSHTDCRLDNQTLNATTSAARGSSGKPQKLQYVATNGEPFPWRHIRLPTSVIPQNYDIVMHPNISASFFKGKVTMTLNVAATTDFIVFHTLDLNHTAVEVFLMTVKQGTSDAQTTKEKLGVSKVLEFVAHQQLYVKLDRTLDPGRVVQLSVGFRGLLANVAKMHGLYKSTYTVNSQQRFMASTQFEAAFARNAFPCFDEPAFKATFNMSIVRDPNHFTLFNTPLESSSPYSNDLQLDRYERTVRMSTYLLAFVVCDFKSISSKTKDNVDVRVFAPEDNIYMGHYALNTTVKVIEFYNDFFGIPYPLRKVDLIAIPNFAAGAMENWGLITYRDTAILYDPQKSTENTKEWVATVVAHELAHQWFGNLVTMKWWNDIWLNEGFATYMSLIAIEVIDKAFVMSGNYLMSLTDALFLDSLTTSHPIEVTVHDPVEIESAFDRISYDKGSCLIHMVLKILGQDNFKKGLTNYLREHSYANAETKDLWDALGKVSQLPDDLSVSKVMDTWTQQMGYPVVTVTQKAGKLFLSQQRFLVNKDMEQNAEPSPFRYKWNVAFTYTTSDDPAQTHQVWMKMDSAEVTLPASSSPVWIKGNARSQGFYRVNYDENGWKAIIKQLEANHELFPMEDRVGLLDDVFTLAWSNDIKVSIALDMSLYLVKERNYFVLANAVSHLSSLAKKLYLHESFDNLQALRLHLIRPLIDLLGWENKGDHLERKMRSLILSLAVTLKYKPAVDKAKSLFEEWKADQDVSLNNDLRHVIYNAGIKYGNKKDWDLVFERYQHSKVPSEKKVLLISLAASTDPRTLQIFMERGLDTNQIKSQDTPSLMNLVAANPIGFLYAWRFLRENWDTFFDRYGSGSFMMTRIIKGTVSHFSTQFDYDEVTAFFADKKLGSAAMGLEQAKEVVQAHIHWERNNLEEVEAWFKDPNHDFSRR